MFGLPLSTGMWLWGIPFLLLVLQFVYCIKEDKKQKN